MARHRHEKREARMGNMLSYTEANWPGRRAEGILYGCEMDRDLRSAYIGMHVDGPSDVILAI